MLNYLRIAVTALCLTASLLQVAMWVQSHQFADVITFPISSVRLVGFGSAQGTATAMKGKYRKGYYDGYWARMRSDPIVDSRIVDYRPESRPEYPGAFGFGVIHSPPFEVVCMPHWFVGAVTLALAASPCARSAGALASTHS